MSYTKSKLGGGSPRAPLEFESIRDDVNRSALKLITLLVKFKLFRFEKSKDPYGSLRSMSMLHRKLMQAWDNK